MAGTVLALVLGTALGAEDRLPFVRVSPRDPRYFELAEGKPPQPVRQARVELEQADSLYKARHRHNRERAKDKAYWDSEHGIADSVMTTSGDA
jgi:hypothetical protein